MAKKRKKKKKGSFLRKFLTFIFILVVLGISGAFVVSNVLLGDIDKVEISDDLNISEELNKNENIVNIALFGIDTREEGYSGRADTIMIGTLDKEHKKLKLTSIMRDTYVSIPGEKYDKINHSYAYGGPELAIKTINQNFDMNIRDYVTVNFEALEKIVDAVGGVEIDVKQSEIEQFNIVIKSFDNFSGKSTKKITSSGLQTLSGRQALAYSRIRYAGNGDYERTERQRTVLENIVNKVLNDGSLAQALSLIKNLSPYIETSLNTNEMVSYATSVFTSGIKDMENTRLPLDKYSQGGTWDGTFYLKPRNLSDNVTYLHEFIYEESDYIPTSTVSGISNEIQ
ncbi:LytR family transcriptional attenuator [Alkalibaculum bacchi]|uniref:LytR family transcriptional attenuator n=1 Tax=Alkalibaculum bacchi TaxID=645887 RepID=A0A366IG65_9FIRM|nr:LCP family protein [Alkalibaculum bacchi]RBP69077.1 LytR family transcriptional attenuator [Alkalibaculum bacchi]